MKARPAVTVSVRWWFSGSAARRRYSGHWPDKLGSAAGTAPSAVGGWWPFVAGGECFVSGGMGLGSDQSRGARPELELEVDEWGDTIGPESVDEGEGDGKEGNLANEIERDEAGPELPDSFVGQELAGNNGGDDGDHEQGSSRCPRRSTNQTAENVERSAETVGPKEDPRQPNDVKGGEPLEGIHQG